MNEIRTLLRLLVAYQPRPSRWRYLPFLLIEGGLGLLALGEGDPGSWPRGSIRPLLGLTLRQRGPNRGKSIRAKDSLGFRVALFLALLECS